MIIAISVAYTDVYAMDESISKESMVEAEGTEKERLFTKDYIVIVERTAIRSKMSSASEILRYVYKDNVVHVSSIENGWAKVKYDSKTGYILLSCLKKM